MKTWLLYRFTVRGLYPEGAVFKLKRAQIPLFALQKTDKTTLQVCVERKYRKKVFTILNNSCYNILKVEYYGFSRALHWLKTRLGLIIGAGVFACLCALSNLFVLRIEVVGTGNYYQREILSLLSANGVGVGRTYSANIAPTLTAQILALDNVSFCSLKKTGSTLRVEVQTSPSASLAQAGALLSPADGRVYSLTVVKGTPNVQEGDEVVKDQLLVGTADTEGQEIVMASVQILCRYAERVAPQQAQAALAQALLAVQATEGAEILDAGKITPDGEACIIELSYLVTKKLNM